MSGKEKCELLRKIRRIISEANNIPLKESECTHEGECTGTCPQCDEELMYLGGEIKRRADNGENISVPDIDMDTFETIAQNKKHSSKRLSGKGKCIKRNNDKGSKVMLGFHDNIFIPDPEEVERIRNGGLEMLGLSEMSYGCMKMAGKKTVKDILAMTEKELHELSEINTVCHDEIRYRVSLYDLEFDYEKRRK